MKNNFIHLHTHSHYSLLDGLAKIDDLIAEAVNYKMPALALTDHGNLYGAVEFYKKAAKAGIKPIIGIEAYIAKRSMHDKEPQIDDKRYHLVLLAENNEGYKNLIKLTTAANLEGFYYKPRIDKNILKKHSKGIIALSACMSGELSRVLLNQDIKRAEELVSEYKEIFGKDNFFIELEYHPNIPNHSQIQKALVKLANATKTPVVAAQDIHYIKSEDKNAQDVLLAVQTNSKLDDEDRLTMKEDDFSFTSPEKMREFFKEIPEALANTQKIAERCDVKLKFGELQLPHFEVPKNYTPETYLEYLAKKGLKIKFENPSKEVKDRVERDKNSGTRLGVSGTPSFFLNGDKIPNPKTPEDFKTFINAAILKAPKPSGQSTGEKVHEHADLALYVNGKKVLLQDRPEYFEKDPDIHSHKDTEEVIHKHKTGVTLGQLIDSWKANLPSGVSWYVNGKKQTGNWRGYEFKDLDRIVMSFSTTTVEVSDKQLSEVTDRACIYSEKCPERGKPPTENCVGGLGTDCD